MLIENELLAGLSLAGKYESDMSTDDILSEFNFFILFTAVNLILMMRT
jgi:hypothetical protein